MKARNLLVGRIPRRTRRQERALRCEQRVRHFTVTHGKKVALGHGRGTRLGVVVGFVHTLGVVEARVEWSDGPSTIVRADALRRPTRKDRRR